MIKIVIRKKWSWIEMTVVYIANLKLKNYCMNIVQNDFKLTPKQIILPDSNTEIDFDFTDIVFCLPEWNGSYPWFFKKFIDEKPCNFFKDKTVHLILWSSGNNFALSIRHSLLILCSNLKMNISNNIHYITREK
jgi:putative NADPH-quinone reductase